MICLRCLARRPSSISAIRRSLHEKHIYQNGNTRLFSQQTELSDAAQPFTTPPAASPSSRNLSISSAASAPQTEIITDAPSSSTSAGASADRSASIAVRSGTPAGTILRGLNFQKDKSDPLAMEDNEYPEWLWTVLDEIRGPASVVRDRKADSAKSSKKKKGKKDAMVIRDEIPIHQQTIDLPTSDGSEESIAAAAAARASITKAMRAERRAKIKESNFLKTMR